MTITNPEVRRQYRTLLLHHTDFSNISALIQLVSDTRLYADKRQWLPLFDEVLLRTAVAQGALTLADDAASFPTLRLVSADPSGETVTAVNDETVTAVNGETVTAVNGETVTAMDVETVTAMEVETPTPKTVETPTPKTDETPKSSMLKTLLSFQQHALATSFDSFLEDLVELCYADMRIAFRVWEEFLPVVWRHMARDEQLRLTQALTRFLASDIPFLQRGVSTHLMWEELDRDYKQWHAPAVMPYGVQARSRYGSIPCTNGVQALLEGVLCCEPQPRLAPVLLLNLAKMYGCAPQASLLLESGLRDCEARERSVYLRCLRQTYEELKEEDAAAAMVTCLPYPELHNGMVLERFGRFQTAQVAYLEGLRNQEVVNSAEALTVVKERWKECALNLRQWIPLFEYGKLNRDIVLLLECYGKCNIWDSYPKLYVSSVLSVEGELMQPRAQLLFDKWSIIQCVQNGSSKYRSHLSELLMKNYRAMGYQPLMAYDSLLHLLYQNNDITFSTLLVGCNPQKGFTNEVNSLLKSFNSYTMNSWDPLSMCEDILIWRGNLYTQFCQHVPPELPRSFISPYYYQIMLSRAARTLQLPEVAAEYLNSIPAESTSMMESLDKWKEKVLVMLDLGMHDASVLTELDHLQLDSMSEMQKSVLFYLKGLYCAKEKRFDDAVGFLMRAVKDDMKNDGKNEVKYPKAWECWGSLLYQRWKERGDVNDAKQCITGCAQQLLGSHEITKGMSRFLHIAFTLCEVPAIASTVSSIVLRIPLVIWFDFLSFLFARPTEAQFTMLFPVLKELVNKYPQIAFFPLLTLCQTAGMKNDSPYVRPTALSSSSFTASVGATSGATIGATIGATLSGATIGATSGTVGSTVGSVGGSVGGTGGTGGSHSAEVNGVGEASGTHVQVPRQLSEKVVSLQAPFFAPSHL